ncbi:MAG: SCO family protein [Burkholderiaceae bacterium]
MWLFADRCRRVGLRTPGLATLLLLAALIGSASASVEGEATRNGGAGPGLDEREAIAASQAAIGQPVPEFTLLDRQGRPVSLASYRGKPLLVSFIYTGCFQVCPATTRNLHDAVKGLDRLLSPNQFNVVSIGFNQPFDSPPAMRAFAAQQRIDYPNWEFLSPEPATVDRLTRGFGFSYVATPAGFDHVLGVTVVDAQGRIYTQVLGDRINAQRLGEPLRQLLTGAPFTEQLRLDTLVERVRILCTVYDPETGEYRYNYALIFELIGGIGFFLTVFGYFLADRLRRRRERLAAAVAAVPAAESVR